MARAPHNEERRITTMNKSRIYFAAGLISVGVTLIPASLMYARTKDQNQQKALKACWARYDSCLNTCTQVVKTLQEHANCVEGCARAFNACTEAAGIHNAPLPPRVHTPEKATPGQKVESTPRPTPRDKAPSGKVLEQSSPTPKPTPSLKKKGTIEKQGM
jgi:hypothetical protein